MPTIDPARLRALQTKTFNWPPSRPLTSAAQARAFVERSGFIHFWPIKGVDLPSLWTAVAGNRPVSDQHDDPGHVTWGWKDDALGRRAWYYAKILQGKATLISLSMVPNFYALSENFGDPREDYLVAYREGRLTLAAKQVYETLLENGAMNSIDLRRNSKLSHARDSEFNKALEILQRDFKILPIGVAEAGAWRYSHVYEIVPRHYADLPEQARRISESSARRSILQRYFAMVGAAEPRKVARLFRWSAENVRRTTGAMIEEGILTSARHPRQEGVWLALTRLCS